MADSLWDTVRIGGLTLRNRAVMPAMETNYGDEGYVTDRLKAYLRRRGEGGAGLIISQVCAVHPNGRGFINELAVYDDAFLPGLEDLAATVRSTGAAVALQLHHAGRQTLEGVVEEVVAPSPIPCEAMGGEPRELTVAEIHELIACYARAAKRARDVGFDAVEVHGAHGYLIHQFLSPYSNRREDEYGGDAEGRFRFAREVVREIKREAGSDFPVIFRFSAADLVEGGYDLEDILPLLPLLEEEGVDCFHVSCGQYDSPGMPTVPGMHLPEGLNVERAAAVRARVRVPVVVAGKIRDPRLADEVIAAGKADMVAFGRQHLADPLFLAKAAEGRYGDIRWCMSCNACIDRLMFEFEATSCAINPDCGNEWREDRSRRPGRGPFLVIGAGPAGLQAAFTFARAGAEAVVVEREPVPGGQLNAASLPPGKRPLAEWRDWVVSKLREAGVSIALGREAGGEVLAERDWTGVVVATGSTPLPPPVPGAGLAKNAEAQEVLLGRREVGEHVLIVGAGLVGMETAAFLMERGHRVTVVEARSNSPVMALSGHGYFLHEALKKGGELLLSTRVVEVTERGARVDTRGEERELEANTVIWAVGSKPERSLAALAEEAGLAVEVAGDAVEPRRVFEAVHEGQRAAEELLYRG